MNNESTQVTIIINRRVSINLYSSPGYFPPSDYFPTLSITFSCSIDIVLRGFRQPLMLTDPCVTKRMHSFLVLKLFYQEIPIVFPSNHKTSDSSIVTMVCSVLLSSIIPNNVIPALLFSKYVTTKYQTE
ncbi:hypothetical protein Hanom_Chr03g00244601 [Helianthus anomalus]